MIDRDAALALLHEYTKTESLRNHAYSVEAAMRWYARHFDQNKEATEVWGITGLLHDFDYERFPDPTPPDGHPFMGVRLLREAGYPEDLCQAILGHAAYTGVLRQSLMAKALFAVDELCGLITAAALVRPDKEILNLEVPSILKRFKEKTFARGCNRGDITLGAEELGVSLEQHIGNVLAALKGRTEE